MKILKFQPILKSTIWGGNKITAFKHLPSADGIGESWELSGVAGSETICSDGSQMNINEMVALHGERLVGKHCYEQFGNVFPLLIKFIDSRSNLSIQVHPDDETAHRQGKSAGKTEMWYLIKSDPGARLYSGLKQPLTPKSYKAHVEQDTICDVLAQYEVKEDDVFFIPAGRIHAIGAGCFLAEIQQTSDVTYRIYDYNRRDSNGHTRELHTDLAAEAIHYDVEQDYRTEYEPRKNEGCEVVSCQYFTTTVYDITEKVAVPREGLDSFSILIALKGSGQVTTDGHTDTMREGETLLIAAENRHLEVEGEIKFLEVHV